jgi:Ca2+:H+ antiporter
MIIAIYALKNGMIRIVQQSLLGSILSNMLLVVGCAFFAGGIVHRNKDQVFSKVMFVRIVFIFPHGNCLIIRSKFYLLQANAVVNSGLLLMAVMGLMFPAVLHFTHSEVQQGASEVALSRFSSCIMLVAYASYLYFQLSGRNNSYTQLGNVSVVHQ